MGLILELTYSGNKREQSEPFVWHKQKRELPLLQFPACGADSQIRTGDLVLTKDVLYLLSHISIISFLRQFAWRRKPSDSLYQGRALPPEPSAEALCAERHERSEYISAYEVCFTLLFVFPIQLLARYRWFRALGPTDATFTLSTAKQHQTSCFRQSAEKSYAQQMYFQPFNNTNFIVKSQPF